MRPRWSLTLFFLRAHAEVRPYRIIVQIMFCFLLFSSLLILLLMPSFNGRGVPPCAPAMSASRCFLTGAHRGTPLQNNRADYVLFFLLLVPSFNGMGLVRCLPPPSRGRSGGDCLGNRGQLINPPQLPLSKREKYTRNHILCWCFQLPLWGRCGGDCEGRGEAI